VADGFGITAGKVAASAAPSVWRWGVRRWRLRGTIDPAWLGVGDDDSPVSLTPAEHEDLTRFLASDPCKNVLMLFLACRLADPFDISESSDLVCKAFVDEAKRWCADKPGWSDRSAAIWDRVVAVVEDAVGPDDALADFHEEIDEFTAFAQSPLSARGGAETSAKQFVSRLLEVGSDLDRLDAANQFAVGLAVHQREQELPPIISHTEVDHPADFSSLYVARTFDDPDTGEQFGADDLTSAGRGFRIVLLGNPGAGKSTFVRHVSWSLARDADALPSQASIIIKCREYANQGWGQTLVEFIAEKLHTEGVLDAEPTRVGDALTLGQLVVIFDGLDEVTDIQQRIEMVARVNTFCRTYPLTSVLVTSREVGYPRASLPRSLFHHYTLREFSNDQVGEYVDRWFAHAQAEHLASDFKVESETVKDLRQNPLLLSLLCILFKARGAIPRRRREVYSKCADLLFNTWDSHRQISQPEELPVYGNRLMQEIARWVYSSTSAQNGLEEGQIVKVISSYLEGVAGLPEDDARLKAIDFLDFCAGRAWLLGSFGSNDYGQRIFGFTHRTFLEFFTAEAYSRQAKDAEAVSDHIEKAYATDSTSVLPELLLQAFDERQENGAFAVFKELCGRGAKPGLLLRLMNGALLPAKMRTEGFGLTVTGWAADFGSVGAEGIDAFFSLDKVALEQFQTEWLQSDDKRGRAFFSYGWASLYLSGRRHFAGDTVAQIAEAFAVELVARREAMDLATYNWLVASGKVDPPTGSLDDLLAAPTAYGMQPGAIWVVLNDRLRAPEGALGGSHDLLAAWVRLLPKRRKVAERPIAWLRNALVERLQEQDSTFDRAGRPSADWDDETFLALMGLAMAISEVGPTPSALLGLKRDESGASFADAETVRRWKALDSPEPDQDEKAAAARLFSGAPAWAQRWLSGSHNLVMPYKPEEDDY